MRLERATNAIIIGLMIGGYSFAVAAVVSVVALLLETNASPPGAGPVLCAALDSGWRPGPAPKRTTHDCSMCKNCCDKCNVEDKCCCKHVDKCPCPPPASPTRNP